VRTDGGAQLRAICLTSGVSESVFTAARRYFQRAHVELERAGIECFAALAQYWTDRANSRITSIRQVRDGLK
jgi:hypothetical protein